MGDFRKYSLNRRAFWVPVLALSFAGIRSYRVGTDTGAYVSNYISNLNPAIFSLVMILKKVINYLTICY
jgi:hypothetical protein